jgi:hypothetical protein
MASKVRSLPDQVEGWDDKWFVICCVDCGTFFDVPITKNNLPRLCLDCLSPASRWNRIQRAAAAA